MRCPASVLPCPSGLRASFCLLFEEERGGRSPMYVGTSGALRSNAGHGIHLLFFVVSTETRTRTTSRRGAAIDLHACTVHNPRRADPCSVCVASWDFMKETFTFEESLRLTTTTTGRPVREHAHTGGGGGGYTRPAPEGADRWAGTGRRTRRELLTTRRCLCIKSHWATHTPHGSACRGS